MQVKSGLMQKRTETCYNTEDYVKIHAGNIIV